MTHKDPAKDSHVPDAPKTALQVDPEFIYKVEEGAFLVAYVMVIKSYAKVEYWHMKAGWGQHRPGAGGPKTWTFTPVSAKDSSYGYPVKFPNDLSEATALAEFKNLFKMESGDEMRKHTVEVI
jgi:hypothetical protein